MSFYTKKRKGKFWDFTNWIVESPKAMSVMMFLQPISTFILMFAGFTYFVINGKSAFAVIVFFIFSSFMALKSYKVIVLAIKAGGVDKICDSSAKELVWGKDNGNIEQEYNEQHERSSREFNEGNDTETRRNNRAVKRSHTSFRELVGRNK